MEIQAAYEAMRRYFAAKGSEEAAAYEGNGCKYRTEDGRCCAVGCLIPPALYTPEFDARGEGAENAVGSVFGFLYKDTGPVAAVADFLGINDENVRAWSTLQGAHDDVAIKAWSESRTATGNEVVAALDKAAEELGLETPYTIRLAALAKADEEVKARFGA